MGYQPIEHYGVIGNMRTAALVSTGGSIDWLCVPHFDSPSVFGALLDDAKGGRFRLAPVGDEFQVKQLYWPDTNVLVTRFLAGEGVGEVVDFMPVGADADEGRALVVRRVSVSRGSVRFALECTPAFDYARAGHELTLRPHGALFHGATLDLGLSSSVRLERAGDGVAARFTLSEGQGAAFLLQRLQPDGSCRRAPSPEEVHGLFERTVGYWRRWLSHCTYSGRWREIVHRSALALKLLTFEPTGAIVAAPTCSLPEVIGGVRNWDYRYVWVRDAAFTVYALLRLGFTEEANRFMRFLMDRCEEVEPDSPLQIVYGIDGRHDLAEETLNHLDGYRGSRPVRIGNLAYKQLQLDIYGELMDAAYLANKYGNPMPFDAWRNVRRLVNWVCDNWQRPDEGIWEFRTGARNFVYSKLMCWVAVDRALRLADKRSFPADRGRWLAIRDQIYEDVIAKGFNAERRAFVQAYGSSALDASNLIMPLVFFMAPNDPRMVDTFEAINRPPAQGGLVSDGLVYRYDVARGGDGLVGAEGTFNMCTFWLVEALARAGRTFPERLDEARLIFERMLGQANHLGLFPEQLGRSGEALGNFPQGFTHLALISAAFNLDRQLRRG